MLKPKHSGFQFMTLDVLLEHLGAETLILTGGRRQFLRAVTKADVRPSAAIELEPSRPPQGSSFL